MSSDPYMEPKNDSGPREACASSGLMPSPSSPMGSSAPAPVFRLECLFTVATSRAQHSYRMPTIEVPEGESVAVSSVLSLRQPSTGETPPLNTSMAYDHYHYVGHSSKPSDPDAKADTDPVA